MFVKRTFHCRLASTMNHARHALATATAAATFILFTTAGCSAFDRDADGPEPAMQKQQEHKTDDDKPLSSIGSSSPSVREGVAEVDVD